MGLCVSVVIARAPHPRPPYPQIAMPDASSFIHLRSHKFVILPGEKEELINEGTYGKALAIHLQEGLQRRGWTAPSYCCEDWGWWVEVKGQPFGLGLCIYCLEQDDERLDLWVTVEPAAGRRWSWSRFRFVDTTAAVERLFAELTVLLTNDSDIEVLGFHEELGEGEGGG